MLLHLATQEDFCRVAAFYRDVIARTPDMPLHARWVYGQHPTDELLSASIGAQTLYLYEAEGRIAGAAVLTPCQSVDYHALAWSAALRDDDVAVLHLLAISPDAQGRGAAGQMLEALAALARAHGKHALRLDALSSNAPAQRLYRRHGFVHRGTQRLYAENTGLTDFDFFERNL